MTDADIVLTGLDDQPLEETKHSYRVDRPRMPERKYSAETKRFLKQRQQQRIRALTADGYAVRVGRCGATVFRDFGGYA